MVLLIGPSYPGFCWDEEQGNSWCKTNAWRQTQYAPEQSCLALPSSRVWRWLWVCNASTMWVCSQQKEQQADLRPNELGAFRYLL